MPLVFQQVCYIYVHSIYNEYQVQLSWSKMCLLSLFLLKPEFELNSLKLIILDGSASHIYFISRYIIENRNSSCIFEDFQNSFELNFNRMSFLVWTTFLSFICIFI